MRVQDGARPARPHDRHMQMGLGRRPALPANHLRALVDFEELRGGERAFVQAGRGDREAHRLRAHDRAEISAGAERPAARVEIPAGLRELLCELAKSRIAAMSTAPRRRFSPNPPCRALHMRGLSHRMTAQESSAKSTRRREDTEARMTRVVVTSHSGSILGRMPMAGKIKIRVNERMHEVDAAPDTPLLYVLADDLQLQGPRFGCGLAQCGSCSVLVDGVEIRSCVTPVSAVAGQINHHARRLARRGTRSSRSWHKAPALHPVQQAMHRRAGACSAATAINGMIVKAAELLSKMPQPTDAEIRTAMNGHLCRCGSVSARDQGDPARVAGDGGEIDGASGNESREIDAAEVRDEQNRFGRETRHANSAARLSQGGRRARDRFQQRGLCSDAISAQGPAIARGPDAKQIDTWLAIHADNTATIFIGYRRARPGHLDLAAADCRRRARSRHEPGQHGAPRHRSSRPIRAALIRAPSIARGGPRRFAPPRPRLVKRCSQMASKKLDAPVEQPDGRRRASCPQDSAAKTVTYGELIGDKHFDLAFTGTAPLKPAGGLQARRRAPAAQRHSRTR